MNAKTNSIFLGKKYLPKSLMYRFFGLMFCCVIQQNTMNAATINVSTIAALNSAITSAAAGDIIVLADGNYGNSTITIGTSNITVKAATPGGVLFNATGVTTVSITGNYVTFSGFQFINGVQTGSECINVVGDHVILTQLNFSHFSAQKYINVRGQYDEITYSNFQDKPTTSVAGDMIHIYSRADSTPNYTKIRYCSFQNMPGAGGDNGNECIRITNANPIVYIARVVVEFCYFNNTGLGDSEAISVKSYENVLRYNTMVNNQKANFCWRYGSNNVAYGNFFINSGGFRFKQANNIYCYNNYFENCGDGIVSAPVKYVASAGYLSNLNIVHNTFVGGTPIEFDTAGTNNVWANNIFKKTTGNIFSGPVTSNTFAGNIYSGTLGVTITSGMTNIDPQLVTNSDGYYGLSATSPGIDAASASYPAILDIASIDDDPTLTLDISGQARPVSAILKDVGCDEYTSGPTTNHPLALSEVGPIYLGGPGGKLNQTITFNALAAKTVGDVDYSAGATASSGLTVSYVSSNTAVATIVGGNIHVVGAGTSTITASQAGDATYNAATSVPQTLTVNKINQTITFNALAAKTVGDVDYSAGATASSGLTVSYVSSNTAVATIVGGNIHIVGAGTATITASQVGNTSYNAATSVPQTLTVNMANQTITFNALAAKVFGDADYSAGATASSGLTVSYVSSNTAVATIVGGNIHIVSAGTATITASQAGNTNYNAATSVPQALTVNMANQTITFNALSAKVVGDVDYSPGATASSGLTVSYVSSNTTVATIVGGNIHIVGAGTSDITASQAGDTNYTIATDVMQVLTVSALKLDQIITFSALSAKTIGDIDYSAGATASSGLTVSYVSSNTAVATIVGGNIHIVGAGTSTITASQAGDATYNAATSVPQTLTVNKINQTITFTALAAKVVGDADFSPGATASSGLTVSYVSSNTAVATIVSGNIHIVGAGTSTITASQAGNANYNAATSVPQTLNVTGGLFVTNYAPSNSTILSGTANSGSVAKLALNDNTNVLVINSTKSGTRVLDWYGSVSITQSPATVTKLTINYDGKNSISRTQVLYLYNWSTLAWVQIDSRTVSTSDVLITNVQNTPANFISSTGEIRLRVYSTGGNNTYTCSGDWMQFTVESTAARLSAKNKDLGVVAVYPNPTSSSVNVSFEVGEKSKVQLDLYNMNGQMVKNSIQNEVFKSGSYTKTIDVSDLKAGLYLVSLRVGEASKVMKLVLTK